MWKVSRIQWFRHSTTLWISLTSKLLQSREADKTHSGITFLILCCQGHRSLFSSHKWLILCRNWVSFSHGFFHLSTIFFKKDPLWIIFWNSWKKILNVYKTIGTIRIKHLTWSPLTLMLDAWLLFWGGSPLDQPWNRMQLGLAVSPAQDSAPPGSAASLFLWALSTGQSWLQEPVPACLSWPAGHSGSMQLQAPRLSARPGRLSAGTQPRLCFPFGGKDTALYPLWGPGLSRVHEAQVLSVLRETLEFKKSFSSFSRTWLLQLKFWFPNPSSSPASSMAVLSITGEQCFLTSVSSVLTLSLWLPVFREKWAIR